MKLTTIKTEVRSRVGSAESRRVRRSGLLPAVIYGLTKPPHSCSIDAATFEKEVDAGHRTFQLTVDGKQEAALLKDVQWDTFGIQILHVDFERVDLTVKVKVSVALHFEGHPEMQAGTVVDHVSEDVMVECLPTEIPNHIVVPIGNMTIGSHIEAKDLKLPAGVTLAQDPHRTLVSYHYKAVEVAPEATPAAGEGAAAEPVVLKEKKEEPAAEKTDKK